MPKHARLALCGALVLAGSQAFGSTGVSAEMTGFRIQLFDTNLQDGITPSIQWGPEFQSSSNTFGSGSSWGTGSGFGSTSASSWGADLVQSASVAGSGSAAGPATISASGSSTGYGFYYSLATPVGSSANPLFGLAPWYDVSFKLSGNTLMTVSAVGSVSASISPKEAADQWVQGGSFAWASFGINGEMGHAGDYVGVSVSPGGTPGAGGLVSASLEGVPMLAKVENSTGSFLSGSMYAYAVAGSNGFAAPVPEPSTYALMGLGLFGIWSLRRRHPPRAALAA